MVFGFCLQLEVASLNSSKSVGDRHSFLLRRVRHTGHSFLLRRVRRAVGGAHFDSPEGDFIIYRLLVAQPWPERLANPGMYHRFERPIADAWCRWSLYWLWSLSRVWREANAARGGAV